MIKSSSMVAVNDEAVIGEMLVTRIKCGSVGLAIPCLAPALAATCAPEEQ